MADAGDLERRLRLARQVFSPSDEHRERVRSALASTSIGEKAAAAGRVPPVARRVAGTIKAALLVGAGFALGYWFAETRPTEGTPTMTERAAAAREDAPPAALADGPVRAEAPQPAAGAVTVAARLGQGDAGTSAASGVASTSDARRVESRRAATPRRMAGSHRPQPATETSRGDSFQDELALLARAERAIRSGNATLARSFIGELEARFPKTALQQERAALLVLAACATDEPAAQRDAREFLRHHEQSVYVARIRSMCKLDPSAP